ncbi:hypothetical protein CDAR_618261 [Caerostris darwini]|uniref:Uncharacterized protein n=1 Tax=Caerostris darwini TaxID=1538125 RepID=A0AAV4SS18_9ARAC|nr:hypothetical protein CDAR_618261 [Caerostris darwini]
MEVLNNFEDFKSTDNCIADINQTKEIQPELCKRVKFSPRFERMLLCYSKTHYNRSNTEIGDSRTKSPSKIPQLIKNKYCAIGPDCLKVIKPEHTVSGGKLTSDSSSSLNCGSLSQSHSHLKISETDSQTSLECSEDEHNESEIIKKASYVNHIIERYYGTVPAIYRQRKKRVLMELKSKLSKGRRIYQLKYNLKKKNQRLARFFTIYKDPAHAFGLPKMLNRSSLKDDDDLGYETCTDILNENGELMEIENKIKYLKIMYNKHKMKIIMQMLLLFAIVASFFFSDKMNEHSQYWIHKILPNEHTVLES